MSNPLLVILSPGFPADESDSTCLPLQQSLVQAINREFPGIEIVLIAFQYPFTNKPYLWHNNRIIPLNGRNKGGIARKLTALRGLRVLKQLAKNKAPIGVLSFWLNECALLGHIFSSRRGYKHFAWMLGQDVKPGNRYAFLMRKHSSELVALSDFVAAQFEKNYGSPPANIIAPGIDPVLYPETMVQKDIDILAVGSLIALKQFDLIIPVVKALLPTHPSLKAVICGEGSERKKLLAMISEQQLERHIELIGERPHSEVLELMQRSKLLLHPSRYEGFGMVCLEALYAGAHVISFCRPQEAWIRNWHYVNSAEEMTRLTEELLHTTELDQTPVLAYHINDTAKAFIHLFRS